MIDIAIPKGSLQNQTLQLFEQAGLEVKRTEREYNARIKDPRIGKVKILRPQEIPTYVAKGYFDLGISGTDWIRESGAVVVSVADLNYGKTGPGMVKLVVAVPESLDIQQRGTDQARQPRGHRVSLPHRRLLPEAGHTGGDSVFLRSHRGQGAGADRCGGGSHRDRIDAAKERPEDHRRDA